MARSPPALARLGLAWPGAGADTSLLISVFLLFLLFLVLFVIETSLLQRECIS